ncbi:MAG: single-stranded DNA-binding protein [Bacilli bacterium]|nr:single-stranded DNA-binding protein [Bacilli bacterium]
MNKVWLTGALTKDIELRNMGDGKAVAKFSLAVRRTNGEADFINCVAFGLQAETLSKCVKKGSRLGVEGHIQTGSYTNSEGKKVYTTDVILDRMEFLDKKPTDENENKSSSEIIREVVESNDFDNDLPF